MLTTKRLCDHVHTGDVAVLPASAAAAGLPASKAQRQQGKGKARAGAGAGGGAVMAAGKGVVTKWLETATVRLNAIPHTPLDRFKQLGYSTTKRLETTTVRLHEIPRTLWTDLNSLGTPHDEEARDCYR